MAFSSGASEPHERTAFLNGEKSRPIHDATNITWSGNADGHASKRGFDGDGGVVVDEEPLEVTDNNPFVVRG
jgi:hypothetical protein